MNPLAKLQNLVGLFLEILQSNDPLADAPKTGPALLLSDCGLGDTPVDDEWKPSVHDDQGEALEPPRAPSTASAPMSATPAGCPVLVHSGSGTTAAGGTPNLTASPASGSPHRTDTRRMRRARTPKPLPNR
jgi:hypothetical protein